MVLCTPLVCGTNSDVVQTEFDNKLRGNIVNGAKCSKTSSESSTLWLLLALAVYSVAVLAAGMWLQAQKQVSDQRVQAMASTGAAGSQAMMNPRFSVIVQGVNG